MSSLAATQADGMYIPPDYLESGAYKKKSLNQYANSKGHNQFLQRNVSMDIDRYFYPAFNDNSYAMILLSNPIYHHINSTPHKKVCRFELPFDGFCTDCHAIIGKGTRFNTHKAHVDDYFSTKIYEFTTRCRSCGNTEFKIRTNPKERTFDYVSGIRKKVEEFNSAEAGTHGVIDTEFGNGILQYKNGQIQGAPDDPHSATSSLNLLEKNVAGHRKVQTEHEHMESLLKLNSWKGEDAEANASLRASFRIDRKAKKRRLGDASKMGLGKGIELKGATDMDAKVSKHTIDMHKRQRCGNAYQSEKEKFSSVRSGSIFSIQKKSPEKRRRKHAHVDNLKKEKFKKKDDREKKLVVKQKMIIHTQSYGVVKSAPEECNQSPDCGAVAALSNLYGSDSD